MVLWLFCVLLCVVCVLFSFKIILMGKRESGGFTLFIFLVACDYFILSWVGLHCVFWNILMILTCFFSKGVKNKATDLVRLVSGVVGCK